MGREGSSAYGGELNLPIGNGIRRFDPQGGYQAGGELWPHTQGRETTRFAARPRRVTPRPARSMSWCMPEPVTTAPGRASMTDWGAGLDPLFGFAAYAAAVVAIVIIWILYKRATAGARVVVECKAVSDDPSQSAFTRRFRSQIELTITNNGDRPTSVIGIEYHVYHSWWAKFRQQPYGRIAVNLGGRDVLPWKIEPGEVWAGFGPEPPMHLRGHARLYVVVRVTTSRKGIQCPLVF